MLTRPTLTRDGCTNTSIAGELKVGSPVARMARHANSALLAVACDDLSIRMFDVEVGLGSFTDTTRSAFHQMFALHCHTPP